MTDIEGLILREYREHVIDRGASPLVVARQVCRSLDDSPMLKRLLEDMLAASNQQHYQLESERQAFREAIGPRH